ncbi:hypothetical protein FIV06_14765 [Labrenzia sp. THAF191b]|uniref:hypothetical protein n=1 Tax=unclassified Labrenzia TaxID=2648686 RepID=UPI0012683A63|nr:MULTISPECIES: hypothetical protein [unclassified Labrenzia]QFS98687.1 hypothetical protein FIV06_14765 [Labrenzia sp. THAF191b]QFT05001.1 hypothetical protein FIV05_14760 [Labrenzia sp. THAF191a]QFT16545.1 hypothetical protein FIV03_14775 [Labrenzia sp. THAF187b]
MSKQTVVALDHAKVGTLLAYTVEKKLPKEQMRNKVFSVLDAVAGLGDKVLYVPSVGTTELTNNIAIEYLPHFDGWLKKRTYNNKILTASEVKSERAKKKFDPDNRRNSSRGGYEGWDMDVRQFMLNRNNREKYDFLVISADGAFLDNKFNADNALERMKFRRMSFKSLMISMLTHPDVPLTPQQHDTIVHAANSTSQKFGAFHNLEQSHPKIPESFEAALEIKNAHRPIELNVGKRFKKLVKNGAPVFVLGLAAPVIFNKVQARADERNIPFAQAARELGLEFTEDDLKSMAAEAGLDLAVSLTPVGPLKKAWDVLGNLDDIIALTQLYGEAYPDNLVIRKMAEIATTVEGSEAFGAYVYGRDALTGAVGSAIDWAFAGSEDEEEALQALQGIQNALEAGGAVEQAASRGATREQLTDTLTRDAELRRGQVRQLLSAAPMAATDAPLTAPRLEDDSLSSETILMDGGQVPLGEKPVLPGSSAILAPGFEEARQNGVSEGSVSGAGGVGAEVGTGKLDGVSATTAADVADASAGLAASADLARKSSYDRYRQIGRTAAEEAEALADYERLFRQSYVELGGHKEAARDYAIYRFKQMWGLSAFAPEAEGTVLKYPVETAYPDLGKDGHGYVRKDVEDLLKAQGVRAAKWHLMPNDKTGRDRRQAPADEDGYGPRMTLTYDDETGQRHLLTEDFQANVGRARDRAWQTYAKNNSRRAARQAPAAPAGNVPAALAAAAPGKAAPLDGASTGAR